MKKAGIEVIVELQSRLLPLQLDEEASSIFENTVSRLRLKSGKVIDADLIVFSVGIIPNVNLAKEVAITANKGIVVNEKIETNINDIYACCDTVELNGIIYGNWPAASEMGKIAGANAVGDEVAFESFVSLTLFNAINTQLFSASDAKVTGNNVEVISSCKS